MIIAQIEAANQTQKVIQATEQSQGVFVKNVLQVIFVQGAPVTLSVALIIFYGQFINGMNNSMNVFSKIGNYGVTKKVHNLKLFFTALVLVVIFLTIVCLKK
jgi:hypothetical protein